MSKSFQVCIVESSNFVMNCDITQAVDYNGFIDKVLIEPLRAVVANALIADFYSESLTSSSVRKTGIVVSKLLPTVGTEQNLNRTNVRSPLTTGLI